MALRPVLIALALFGGMFGAVRAEESPRPLRQDSRIRTVTYEHDNVVVVNGALGVSTMILFGDDESIDTVAIGDSVAWQAVPDESKRILFIKPIEPEAVTNMNVVTTRRVYNFILRTIAHDGGVYKIRFTFPELEEDARLMKLAKARAAMPNYREVMASPSTNFDYSYKGADVVKPEYAFDDGVKTFFRFSGEVPGIFVVNPDRSETLANYRREGDIIVVDKVPAQWTMRNGGDTACVFNMRAKPVSPRRTVAADVQPELQVLHAPANTR
jgi:type IV secretion system protein VirB9